MGKHLKKISAIFLAVCLIFGAVFYSEDACAVSTENHYFKTQRYTTGSRVFGTKAYVNGTVKAWTCSRYARRVKSGYCKRKEIRRNSLTAKLLYYYGYKKNYGISGGNAIKLERALTYLNGGADRLTAAQREKARGMISYAKKWTVPELYHFHFYKYTPVSSRSGSMSFIGYKYRKSSVTIGITWPDRNGSRVVSEHGGTPKTLPKVTSLNQAKAQLSKVDGLLVPGGADINPERYGERRHGAYGVNYTRDRSELCYLRAALDKDMPILGLCRGIQSINVASGGSLYQDIPSMIKGCLKHRGGYHHNITVYKGTILAETIGSGKRYTNTWHHQCVKKTGRNIRVSARATDGVIEGIERTDKTFVVGTQFHPEKEDMRNRPNYIRLFDRLMAEAMYFGRR